MTIGEARELVTYRRWANALVFTAAAELSREQLAQAMGGSRSVRETLAHIVGAEWVWLRRWLGENPTRNPAWATGAEVAELRSELTVVEAERDGFLAGLSDADLERRVSYRTLGGQAHADPLSALIRQVVNHSTYHRGQVAMQLRQLGLTPAGTDFIAYLWQAK